MKVKIANLENIVLLHACNFRWAKNITLSLETGIFLARYEDAKSAPKRTYKHAKISKFFGAHTPGSPYQKGRGGVGKGGNRRLAHPKIIPWRPQ
jgi:hypothetical protein